jgi:hypothetical protein
MHARSARSKKGAVYGVIDAETTIQLSDARIAGTTTARALVFRSWTVRRASGFGRGREMY